MKITSQMVKELREKTSAGMMDCKNALTETEGDMEKAVDLLRQKGLAVAAKRAGKETKEGVVESYIHAGGKIGVMVEVACETDFVAKTDDFKAFAEDFFNEQPWIDKSDGGSNENGEIRCIRVINTDTGERVLINSEGYSWCRYTALEE